MKSVRLVQTTLSPTLVELVSACLADLELELLLINNLVCSANPDFSQTTMELVNNVLSIPTLLMREPQAVLFADAELNPPLIIHFA